MLDLSPLAQHVESSEFGDDSKKLPVATGKVLQGPLVAGKGSHIQMRCLQLSFPIIDRCSHGIEPSEHGRQPAWLIGSAFGTTAPHP